MRLYLVILLLSTLLLHSEYGNAQEDSSVTYYRYSKTVVHGMPIAVSLGSHFGEAFYGEFGIRFWRPYKPNEAHKRSGWSFNLTGELNLNRTDVWALKIGATKKSMIRKLSTSYSFIRYAKPFHQDYNFRPEINFEFWKLRVFYGYNFHIYGEKIEQVSRHLLGIRLLINLPWTQTIMHINAVGTK